MKRNFTLLPLIFGIILLISSCDYFQKKENTDNVATVVSEDNAHPSIEKLQQIINNAPRVSGAVILGIHKVKDGEYLVITNRSANEYGGPYQLLLLESGKWALGIGSIYGSFVIFD